MEGNKLMQIYEKYPNLVYKYNEVTGFSACCVECDTDLTIMGSQGWFRIKKSNINNSDLCANCLAEAENSSEYTEVKSSKDLGEEANNYADTEEKPGVRHVIYTLIKENAIDDLKNVLQNDETLLDFKSKDGITPLHFAAFCGKFDIFQILMKDSRATSEIIHQFTTFKQSIYYHCLIPASEYDVTNENKFIFQTWVDAEQEKIAGLMEKIQEIKDNEEEEESDLEENENDEAAETELERLQRELSKCTESAFLEKKKYKFDKQEKFKIFKLMFNDPCITNETIRMIYEDGMYLTEEDAHNVLSEYLENTNLESEINFDIYKLIFHSEKMPQDIRNRIKIYDKDNICNVYKNHFWLHEAAEEGNATLFEMLFNCPHVTKDIINKRHVANLDPECSVVGFTPLHFACRGKTYSTQCDGIYNKWVESLPGHRKIIKLILNDERLTSDTLNINGGSDEEWTKKMQEADTDGDYLEYSESGSYPDRPPMPVLCGDGNLFAETIDNIVKDKRFDIDQHRENVLNMVLNTNFFYWEGNDYFSKYHQLVKFLLQEDKSVDISRFEQHPLKSVFDNFDSLNSATAGNDEVIFNMIFNDERLNIKDELNNNLVEYIKSTNVGNVKLLERIVKDERIEVSTFSSNPYVPETYDSLSKEEKDNVDQGADKVEKLLIHKGLSGVHSIILERLHTINPSNARYDNKWFDYTENHLEFLIHQHACKLIRKYASEEEFFVPPDEEKIIYKGDDWKDYLEKEEIKLENPEYSIEFCNADDSRVSRGGVPYYIVRDNKIIRIRKMDRYVCCRNQVYLFNAVLGKTYCTDKRSGKKVQKEVDPPDIDDILFFLNYSPRFYSRTRGYHRNAAVIRPWEYNQKKRANMLKATNSKGDTILHVATKSGNFDVLRALLHADNFVGNFCESFNTSDLKEIINSKNNSLLRAASRDSTCQVLLLLLGHEYTDLTVADEFDKIPLHYGCELPIKGSEAEGESYEEKQTQKQHLELIIKAYDAIDSNYRDNNYRDRDQIVQTDCEWPLVKKWANSLGTKYNRYKITNNGNPIYRSKTCEVYTAKDVTQKQQDVCLKIIRDAENFNGELNARDGITLDPKFVVELKDSLDNIQTKVGGIYTNTESNGKTIPSWVKEGGNIDEFTIVMPCAEKNLYEAIGAERFAGHDMELVHSICKNVAKALHHMHENGLVHGDVKPRNIVRIMGEYKLIDLDAAEKIGQPIGRKYSSAFAPPELAKLLFTKNGESVDELYAKGTMKSTANAFGSNTPAKRQLLSKASESFDVWGFGCLLYNLCTGRPLFGNIDSSDDNIYVPATAKELMNWCEIDNERLSFVFENIDQNNRDKGFAIDLIRKCLQGDAAKRLGTIADVLKHPYFNNDARDAIIEEESLRASSGTRGKSGTSSNGKKVEELSTTMYQDGSYAVIIAIDDYESAKIDPEKGGFKNLRCAVADATLMKETLQGRGFEIIGELIDKNATKANVEKLMSSMKKTLKGKKNARLVYFLASHGCLDEDKDAYMCCYGADTDYLESTCILLSKFKHISTKLDCSHQLYLLDCCHAGGLLLSTRAKATKYELKLMGSPAIYGMTAVTENQEALEANGHGLFTQGIVNGLNGNAFQQDKAYITANQLFTYVSESVFVAADKKQHDQTPQFCSLLKQHKDRSCSGQFVFFQNIKGMGSGINAVRSLSRQGAE